MKERLTNHFGRSGDIIEIDGQMVDAHRILEYIAEERQKTIEEVLSLVSEELRELIRNEINAIRQ